MRAGLAVPAVVAAVAVLGSGCITTGRELRAQAEQHAPVVPRHEARPLGPAAGLMLVNPLACFAGASGCSGDGSGLCLLLLLGCTGVLGAVDVVALPVQAVRRHGQLKELERIDLSCPVDDPAARAASALADRMVKEFGFTAAPPAEPDAPEVAAADGVGAPAGEARPLVVVRVRTTRFERASGVGWQAAVDFLGPRRKVLLRRECGGVAPDREARTFADECGTARQEVEALADRCVEQVVADLRRRWLEWDPARRPATEDAAPEARAGVYDPWATR